MTTTTITTAIDTTTPTLTRNETAMKLTIAIPHSIAIANDVTSPITTDTPRNETPMHTTLPLIHAVHTSTSTTPEIPMNDLNPTIIPTRSLLTPCLDTSLTDPVANSAAGPANDSAPAEHDASKPARDTSPPASMERATSRDDTPHADPLCEPLEPEDRLEHAEAELDWLHSAAATDPCHAERRAALTSLLERLSPADRGIIERRYDRRVLSPMLADWLYLSTALVVGVHCGAVKLKSGVDAAERMSVKQLEARIRSGRTRRLDSLQRRAGDRFDEAVEAFAALVVPRRHARRALKTAPIAAGDTTG